jgi:K+-transporting ATPase KdpF subunit
MTSDRAALKDPRAGKIYGFFMPFRSSIATVNHAGGGHGPVVCGPDYCPCSTDVGRHRSVRTAAGAAMTTLYWVALVITLGLFGYLLYAMLKAERF